jgi:preprotein translocase subunit SecD
MRTLVRNTIVILLVLVFVGLQAWPPEKKLRLGKDLRGGVSLVYAVNLRPNDPADVIDRVIDVVRERIDPTGQSDITIVKQGQDRLEITMPLPNERVKKLKAAFEEALQRLGTMTLDPSQFERLMRTEPGQRSRDIAKISAGNVKRAEQLNAAASATDAAAPQPATRRAVRTLIPIPRAPGSPPGACDVEIGCGR